MNINLLLPIKTGIKKKNILAGRIDKKNMSGEKLMQTLIPIDIYCSKCKYNLLLEFNS